ncbi:MAG TPA: transposase [Acetobacteraceae bacterium]|nr:transposase [Acetobacteraceae bacterium]
MTAVEIITGVERRRRWRIEDKLRIVGELDEPGACFAEVARRHDVSRGLLWNWRRQVRNGKFAGTEAVQFLPVQVTPEATIAECPRPADPPHSRKRAAMSGAMIEIVLPDGTTVRIRDDVGTAALRRVLAVLRG